VSGDSAVHAYSHIDDKVADLISMTIGKTRHSPNGAQMDERSDPGLAENRGLLRWPPSAGIGRHARLHPPADLALWVECFWMVTWDLDCPYLQETLPHPNFYLAFQDGRCTVGGVNTGKSSHLLEGRSGVFGITFRPGGFRPFMREPAVALANRIVPAAEVFTQGVSALEGRLHTLEWDEDRMLAVTAAFLRDREPAPDANVELSVRLIEEIRGDNTIKAVKDLERQTGMSKRSLQRIFREYVGTTPKWVIQRFRLHELVDRLNSGEQPDWCQLALELGYFDQAHLINAFKAVVGSPPGQYSK